MEIKIERYSINIEIEDDLYKQFEAVAGPADQQLSADVQHQLIELCGDDYDKLLKLNAWIFLCRLMPAKYVSHDLTRMCDYTTVRKLAAAGTVLRHQHNPVSERLGRTTRMTTRQAH